MTPNFFWLRAASKFSIFNIYLYFILHNMTIHVRILFNIPKQFVGNFKFVSN